MTTKQLLTIEFRYSIKPKSDNDSMHKTKTVTIGVFDTFDEAIIEGNKQLEVLEKHFKLNTNWNRKDRFSKSGGCFGSAKKLVTNLAYLQTPFDFYAKITELKYFDLEDTIVEVLKDIK